MTNQRNLLQSSPSPELARLLRSASLDVPKAQGRLRARTAALEALRVPQLDRTTQLTTFALGDSVSRLLNTVTQSDKKVTSLRLVLRASAFGVALGAAALGLVVLKRIVIPTPPEVLAQAASPASEAEPAPIETILSWTPSDLEREIRAGRGANLLTTLTREAQTSRAEATRYQALLQNVRVHLLMGRTVEAKRLADAALLSATPQQTSELRTVLEALGRR